MVEVTADHPIGRADGSASLNFALEGVDCPSCIRKIEGTLRALAGVSHARVNFSTRRLAVTFDPRLTDAEALVEALRARGYRARPYDPEGFAGLSDREDKVLLRALAVAGFAAANVMLLSVSVWAGGDMGAATRSLFHWISAMIALPAIAYAGQPFFRSALAVVRRGNLNMDVPISLAVLLAAAMSLYQTLEGDGHVYFDAAVTLLFFLLVGRYLDQRVRTRAGFVAQNLLAMRALSALVVEKTGRRLSLPIEAVEPGMRVAVAAGERIPVDGRIAAGRSEVDTGLVTGESLPRAAGLGEEVFAGTLNLGGPLEVTATAAVDDSLLAEIVRLMENAEQGRARYVRLADRVARVYAPAVHLLGAATFLAWLLIGGIGWEAALMNGIAVLIVTCPCALGLAVPAVQVVASGRLLRRGVLIKAADGLERLAAVDRVVFDKTGSLTLGRPDLVNRAEIPEDALSLAATLAVASRHPLSRAMVRAAAPVAAMADVREVPGMGLAAPTAGGEVRLGNREWCGIGDPGDRDAGEAGPELWLTRPGATPLRFRFRDRPRVDAAQTLRRLEERGFEIEMLSGDRADSARRVAADLGIERWIGEARPDDKIERLAELNRQGRRVLMVGDGLNDAPALAAAQASISPSTAADISQTAADFVFQGERLAPVAEAVEVARGAKRLILQNFALAFLYNAVAVPLAMAGLVTPLLAALAMSASSILVTLNALRLRAGERGTAS
jgi:Cu2+-exporting ATPase